MLCHDTTSGPAKRKFCQPMHDMQMEKERIRIANLNDELF
jgi:hypothetical protein